MVPNRPAVSSCRPRRHSIIHAAGIAVLALGLSACAGMKGGGQGYGQGGSGNSTAAAARPTPQPSADAKQIDSEVAKILASGNYGVLPAPTLQAVNPNARHVQITTKNDTEYVLTILYSGPTSKRMVLPPRQSETLVIGAGKYSVVAKVESSNVQPYAGTTDYPDGSSYSSSFYIRTGLR